MWLHLIAYASDSQQISFYIKMHNQRAWATVMKIFSLHLVLRYSITWILTAKIIFTTNSVRIHIAAKSTQYRQKVLPGKNALKAS